MQFLQPSLLEHLLKERATTPPKEASVLPGPASCRNSTLMLRARYVHLFPKISSRNFFLLSDLPYYFGSLSQCGHLTASNLCSTTVWVSSPCSSQKLTQNDVLGQKTMNIHHWMAGIWGVLFAGNELRNVKREF